MKSIDQILREAHEQIRRQHGVALEHVRFQLVWAGGCDGVDYAVGSDIEIEGKAITVGDGK